jgi:hypothetical protein
MITRLRHQLIYNKNTLRHNLSQARPCKDLARNSRFSRDEMILFENDHALKTLRLFSSQVLAKYCWERLDHMITSWQYTKADFCIGTFDKICSTKVPYNISQHKIREYFHIWRIFQQSPMNSHSFPVVFWMRHSRGYQKNKKYLGSIFFSSLKGGPTYHVIRHISIYGNSHDMSAQGNRRHMVLFIPQACVPQNGKVCLHRVTQTKVLCDGKSILQHTCSLCHA